MPSDMNKPPTGWGLDELSRFLDLIRNNQFASYENCGPLFKRLKED